MAKVDHERLKLVSRSKPLSKHFAVLLREFSQQQKNALVELLKMTKIQVCTSLIFNDYNWPGIQCFNLMYFEYIFLKDTLETSLHTDVLA